MASFNSAAASSSRQTGPWTYDVFHSFRGQDTRLNFVDHLYAALSGRGIVTYKDDEKLVRGELISPTLLKAIEESRFAVVVFSENYANSSWCLEELAKIMKCRDEMGQKVLPVFYHVDPSDVRVMQKRSFSAAFQQNNEKLSGETEKLSRWREALVTASNISGWHVPKAVNEGESKIINKIVQVILDGIPDGNDQNGLIGIGSHMDALNSYFCPQATEKVRMIGIYGMGGIGKTTIARALFQKFAYKFDGSSFVNNVRQYGACDRDICVLQENMIKGILGQFGRFMIRDVHHGMNVIHKICSNKKVFLVLDDVDRINQLEFLAATHEWFGPGSRIIITTRNKHLLSRAHIKYEPNCLLLDQAVKLFSRHAFHKDSPPEGYEELSYRAILYTGYLPLALKVLGAFFCGREANVWESALNRLAKAPDKDIFCSLKLSFDELEDSEKNIFLDIACFFKGEDIERVTRILDSFGFDPVIGISVLKQKSLITVSNNKLGMHDLIQQMGWHITRQSFSNSRLWEQEKIHEFVSRKRKLKELEAIVLPEKGYNVEHDGEKLGLSDGDFRRMKKLRLLDVDGSFISHEPTFLPDKLQWLCWRGYPFSSLPAEHMRKLVGLEIFGGQIQHLWKGRKILPNLKFADFGYLTQLKRFPDISGAPSMERLILSNWDNLKEVHKSLGFHKKLVYLDMSGCTNLKCLPYRIKMESLETLILSFCSSLQRFPEVSPSMTKLSKMHLNHCIQMVELPSSIRYLSGLKTLNLIGCKNLKKIPISIFRLTDLKSLLLDDRTKLKELPKELRILKKWNDFWLDQPLGKMNLGKIHQSIGCLILEALCYLRMFDLSRRPTQIKEEDLPENIYAFPFLEEIYLSGHVLINLLICRNLLRSRLKLLELNKCCQHKKFVDLPLGLQLLSVEGCISPRTTEDEFKEYRWLYNLWFFDD